MRKFLTLVTLVVATGAAQAAEDRMFFSCNGTAGDMAILLTTTAFSDGVVQGFAIERRGLFENYNDQYIKTDLSFAKVKYKPSNPKYKGLEKYIVDTSKDESMVQPTFDWITGKPIDAKDFSQYELLVPPRTELEKVWRSPQDKEPNGEFDAYVQVRFSSGDSFVVVPLHCTLNWKP